MITNLLDETIASRRLLDHSFYRRWSCGELPLDELRHYAKEYFHYALAFPTFLSAAHSRCDDLEVRQEILENLIEEERGPGNHPELWLRFCESLGLSRDEVVGHAPSEATRSLIDTARELALSSTLEGLAALYAYESQVPDVARAKIEGLAEFYGIARPKDIAFFTVHMTADVEHAATARKLLDGLCTGEVERADAAQAAETMTKKLYGFLDGVEAHVRAA